MKLAPSHLHRLPASVALPQYDFSSQKCGMVHLGLGAFHRGHQAVYNDAAMAAGERDWRITGVSLRSSGVRDQLAPQDGLYSITQRSAGEPHTRVIGSVAQVLVAPEDPEAVIASLASETTQVISLTVTEKAYYKGADGHLVSDTGPVRDDLGGAPVTIYGYLARALARRRANNTGALTIMSCDNLAENGKLLRQLFGEFLALHDPDLGDWVMDTCTFPSTMVDRIVPATTDKDIAALADRIGAHDAAAVFTEPFSQWVIEDNFAATRPRWEDHGAQLVADVRPFEEAKLRMLNGAHSALAYIGMLAGHSYVHQAVADPAIRPVIDRLLRVEAAPSLRPAEGQDLDAYADQLLERFANPALEHRLAQIAMDGSQKIPQRWLATLSFHQERGTACPALLEALASWIIHVRGDHGQIDDPQAEKLAQSWRAHGEGQIAAALFGPDGLFASSYTASAENLARLDALIRAQPAFSGVR